MQPETLFKIRFRKELDKIPLSWWVKIQQISLRGVPDFLGCVAGQFVALELKKDSKAKPTALQTLILRTIAAVGGYATVVHPENMEEILVKLRRLGKIG